MQTGRWASPTRCGLTRSGHRLEVSGEIDEANANALGTHLGEALDDGVTVVDLTAVTFFSAAGVRMLLEVGRGAAVAVRVCCSPQVWRILDVCGVPAVDGLVLEPPPNHLPVEGAVS
ncbi:STAS domain-containing protein [Cryptosporangium sp. NPDC048952]|uniref:STAS domain-containing protein n=1 Tax=Cryptosporangium sp. NPDC048952 TaxID=3363961 RepID=UPI0037199697